jgi:exopolysaccharide biosynthesis protein
VRDSAGRVVPLTRDTTILQVGPTLIDEGRVAINARADGLFWEGVDQTFTYNWVLRSNPRSSIAIDSEGRLLLTVIDGRQQGYSEGLSILDHALLLQRLGAVEALNPDGGGSSVIATPAGIINRPSDATGQRRLGNMLLLMP